MYANLVLFTLGPGTRPTAEKLIAKMDPTISALKGYKGITYLGNDEAGQYGALSVWETEEDAEAGFQNAFPQLKQALEGIATEPPTRRLFEVIEPKA